MIRLHLGRREFLGVVAAVVGGPRAISAQPVERMWKVGVLTGQPPHGTMWEPFISAMRDLGYVEGRTIAYSWQSSGGRADRFPDLAAELARLKVDLIVASDNPAIAAAHKAT